MPETRGEVTLDEVFRLARQLSPIDKVRLIERVAPELEHDLVRGSGDRQLSLLGLLRDLGPAPTAREIDEARQEAWSMFPRDNV
jgi:hypothetical protein